MKQIPLTPEIIAKLKAALGEDVDVSGFAVFEAIAINSHPLPGKDGTLFENAVVAFSTLNEMAAYLNSGKHIPLVADHRLEGAPKGRVFLGDIFDVTDGTVELRILFYLDSTEQTTIAKLNSGSLDEVSVAFAAKKILCSECGFDYAEAIAEGNYRAVLDRTCSEGHVIGQNGVHARLVGLKSFYETSVVSVGAAKDPKIVGKSASRLSPQLQRLAASGIELDVLTCSASRGVKRVELGELVTKLETKVTEVATLTASVTTLTSERDAARADLTVANEKIATLTSERDAALEAVKPSEDAAALSAAVEFLTAQFSAVVAATGKTIEAPKTAVELIAGIKENHAALSAILPVGGAALSSDSNGQATIKTDLSAFKARR